MTTSRTRSYCVFAGSKPGADPVYRRAAKTLGETLARRRIRIVYGGGGIGLMGALADAALAHGGHVTGVIPDFLLQREAAHSHPTEMRVVTTMHERKALMADLSDGFIALPGGLGTLEELFEVLTWGQLGLHAKPCGLLNVEGYYDPLSEMLRHCRTQQFVRQEHLAMLIVADEVELLLERFDSFRAPRLAQRLKREQT